MIAAHGLDGLALVPGPNLFYVSGIHTHMSERPVVLFLPADDDRRPSSSHLEAMKAQDAGIPAERIFDWNDAEGCLGLSASLRPPGTGRHMLGVEALHMRVLECNCSSATHPACRSPTPDQRCQPCAR